MVPLTSGPAMLQQKTTSPESPVSGALQDHDGIHGIARAPFEMRPRPSTHLKEARRRRPRPPIRFGCSHQLGKRRVLDQYNGCTDRRGATSNGSLDRCR